MPQYWKRVCQVQVAGFGSINGTQLRVRFHVVQWEFQTPGNGIITITNLNREHANALHHAKEFSRVTLTAGYEELSGVIFVGDLRKCNIGKENPTDTYVTIYAETNATAYNNAMVSQTLKAGSTGKDVHDVLLKAMQQFGVRQGNIPTDLLQKLKYPRNIVLFGDVKHHLRVLANSINSFWHIDINGRLNIVPVTKIGTGATFELNSRTGLIGIPVATQNGVIARCLLNPNIRPGSIVHIDQSLVQAPPYIFNYAGNPAQEIHLPDPMADGIYHVLSVDYVGDTWSNSPWYCELACADPNATPPAQIEKGRS